MSANLVRLCFLAVLPGFISAQAESEDGKIVCYYDSRSYYRSGPKFLISDLELSLQYCTHLVYGYAMLDETDFRVKPLDPELDYNEINYRTMTNLKQRYPELLVLLSVGGGADKDGNRIKYLTLLKDTNHQEAFVSSAREIVETYGFDGVDLAWQFPVVSLKNSTFLGSIWHTVKTTIHEFLQHSDHGGDDDNVDVYRNGFTNLIKQMNLAFEPDGYLVMVSVLPEVNYKFFYSPQEISDFIDGINLFAFDFITPDKKISPRIADYPAPLVTTEDRNPEYSASNMVSWFLSQGMPANKIVLGIPTYGRAWKLRSTSHAHASPPVAAVGEASAGPFTEKKGILSYTEVCLMLQSPRNQGTRALFRVTDHLKQLGTYAYSIGTKRKSGLWVGYEEPETAAVKASYALNKGLAGVAIVEITMDDFKGTCTEARYPILDAVHEVL